MFSGCVIPVNFFGNRFKMQDVFVYTEIYFYTESTSVKLIFKLVTVPWPKVDRK